MEERYIYRSHLKKIQKWMLIIGIPVNVLLVVLGFFIEAYFLIGFAVFLMIYDLLMYKSYDRFTKSRIYFRR
ncbi:hypothetical protein KHQ89_07645 [Mycoplasmatota bacterium]|nr:hypothetical protein KHQ89_07645 [Mycoplasmatota bacterium]